MQTIDRILISRLRFMGDVILTTPLLHIVRNLYPQAHITYLAETPYHTLLQNHPDVDRLLTFRRSSQLDQIKILFTLLNEPFDLAIDLFGNPRSGLQCFLSGASIRIGGDFKIRRRFYTHRIQDDGQRKTAIDFHLQYLQPLGPISQPAVAPYIVVTEMERKWAAAFLEEQGRNRKKKLVGIHPGATWPAKMWLADRFAATASQLTADPNIQLLFTSGPGEIDRVQSIRSTVNTPTLLASDLSLRQLAAVLQQVDVFVSNDCGPLHLAPAVNTRVVGIFGPGEPDIWFPYDPKQGHRLVYHQIDCSQCHRDVCEKMDCMKAISVDQVVDAVYSALKHEVADA